MEKKTIGAFLTALRKANGMTQKELAERLSVSDKTVSRWERDDGAPDLSAIPVLAEIFGVSCDELLRGERKKPADGEVEAPQATSVRGEKERQRLLKATLSRYRDQTYIAMGVSLVGLIVAMIGNLALLKAVLGFLLGLVFFVASVVCQAVFTNRALSALEDGELSGEDLGRLRYQIGTMAEKSYRLTAALLGFTAPLALVDAYMGLGTDSMLLFGIPGGAIAVAVYGVVCFFRRDRKIKAGTYVLESGEEAKYHHNFALKKKLGRTLVIVMAGTLAFHGFGSEMIWSAQVIKRGTTFTDYESFVAYMEQDIDYSPYGAAMQAPAAMAEAEVGEYLYYDADGNLITEDEYETNYLKDNDGNILLTYICRNQEVTQISYEVKDGSALPITVYTYRNLEAAWNLSNAITTIFFVVYPIELLAAFLVYRRKRMG